MDGNGVLDGWLAGRDVELGINHSWANIDFVMSVEHTFRSLGEYTLRPALSIFMAKVCLRFCFAHSPH